MKSILIACVAVVAFAGSAFAAQPDGTFVPNAGLADSGTTIDNLVGHYSAQIIQNGQFVSGNCNCGFDQTTAPGTRATEVQGILASQGKGSQK